MAKSKRGAGMEISRQARRMPGRIREQGRTNYKNLVLEVIRGGTPTQVRSMYKKLIKDGAIAYEVISQETEVDQENLLETDCEIGAEDEDAIDDYDLWQNRQKRKNYQKEVSLDARGVAESEDVDPSLKRDCFEILVEDESCSFSIPDWRGCYRSVSSDIGASAIFEGIRRFECLTAISRWLETDRVKYLKDSLWLNLGPKDYEEVKSGQITVIQKSFLAFLKKMDNIFTEIDESVFSRYLDSCQIVWTDGSMPVKKLFSDEARMGWVAGSIMIFLQHHGHKDMSILREHKIKKPKTRKDKRKELIKPIDNMDISEFVIFANLSAETSWDTVLNTYF